MERLLIRVLQMSLAGSAVILGILLLRLVLRRAPGRFRYLLWSAAAFRLCVPVTLPSPISLFRLFRGRAVGGRDYTPVGLLQPLEKAVPAVRTGAAVSSPALAAQTAAAPLPFPWLRLFAWVWLGVLAGLLAYSLVTALLLRRRLAGAVWLEGRVYEADRIGSPFLMGLFRPRIYIPRGLEGKDLDCVLAHEQVHLRRGDPWWRLLAWLILCVHWYNPLCWLAYLFMGRDMEVSCDEAVLERYGDMRREYCESLLHIAGGKGLSSPAPPAFGEAGVVRRVRNVLRWKRAKGWVTVTALCLCLLFIAACATDPVSGTLALNPDGTLGKFAWGMSPKEAKALDSRLKMPEFTDPVHDFLVLKDVEILGHTGDALLTFGKYSLEGDLHMDGEGTPILTSIRLVFPGEVHVTDALTGLFGEPEKHALSLNHDPEVKNGLFRPWFDPRELPEDQWYWHSQETVLDLVPMEQLRITYPNAAEQIWAKRGTAEEYWLQAAWYARFAYEAHVDIREDGGGKHTQVTLSGDAPAFRRYLAGEYRKLMNGKS